MRTIASKGPISTLLLYTFAGFQEKEMKSKKRMLERGVLTALWPKQASI
jgi:hypothetical protein